MSAKYNAQIDIAADTSHALILRRVAPGSRVLEFGTATGYMTRYLKEELHCTVYGIEVDPQAAEMAKQYCERIIVADLDLLPLNRELQGESFDCLLFADVLEHLRNPAEVLANAVKHLKPGGQVLISVPNIAHNAIIMELLQGKFDYHSTGLLDETHIHFFTRQSLLELLNKSGLAPLELLGTAALPESTEFGQKYGNFPEAVQHFLTNRIDGQVYQYIVLAKHTEEVKQKDIAKEIVVSDIPLGNGFIQAYWPDGTGYTEGNSAMAPLSEQTGFTNYNLNLATGVQGEIRLDLVNFPAFIEISGIELYAVNPDSGMVQTPLICWSAESGFADIRLESNIVLLQGKESLRLISSGEDPHIVLQNIPKIDRDSVLRVMMRVSRDWQGTALEEVTQQLEHIKGLQARVTEQDGELTDLKKELESTQTTLLDLDRRLDAITRSRAWKLANRARKVVSVGRRVTAPLRALFSGGYEQQLIPFTRVKGLPQEGPGVWKALDSDPQFRLSGPWTRGWTEVTFAAASEYPLKLRLYFDRGRGFNEIESLDLDVIYGEEVQDYSVIVPVGYNLQNVRLDPGESSGIFTLKDFKMAHRTRVGIVWRAVKQALQQSNIPFSYAAAARRIIGSLHREGPKGTWQWAKNMLMPREDYELWLRYNTLTEQSKLEIKENVLKLAYKPVFSIVVPVYNVGEKWLRACIDSVLAQLYPYWELCIADDASTDPSVRQVLDKYAGKDHRIKVVYRKENGHISAASNSALELATGEYIALLDNDDMLTPDALYQNALLLNEHRNADMIYSDEDKIDEDGNRHSPFFKPDWSPDNSLGQMYTCHLGVYRTELVRKIGGFRLGFEGSQDHDLVLRLTEKTNQIYHIPKILYHWRTIAQSTAANPDSKGYASIAGEKAVQEALDRRGEGGWSETVAPGRYLVHYPIKGNPKVSILIPTRDMSKFLGPCLDSVFAKTTYENFEIIVIDNGSVETETLQLFKMWQEREPERFKVLRLDIPFNYSKLNNIAAREASGDLILLLNNDVEVITPDWLTEMVGQAIRPSIGAVGAKLLFEDKTIQHAGVTLGIGGVGGHTHRGYPDDDQGYFGRLAIASDFAGVTAACLMIRKEVFEEVGGLEEQLQVAFNDVDFCLKVLSKGYYNILLPHVKLYHYESKSRGYEDTSEKMKRFLSEVALMQDKWGKLLKNDPFYNPNLTLDKEDYTVAIPGK